VRVFVTGGAGFVGSVAVEHLLRDGHDVVVYDDLSTGHRAAVPPGAAFVRGDVADLAALRAALVPGTEAVLHFAARSIVTDSMRDPGGYWRHNVGGALVLLQVVAEHHVPRFVFSSTAGVYGEPTVLPVPESAPARPVHAYGASKRAIEMLLEDLVRGGLRAIWLRYFNAAGASPAHGEDHSPETHLIPNILRGAAGAGKPVTIFGDDWPTPDGTCVRDYVHVDDLARAHVAALHALDRGVGGAVNLGTSAGHSVREILAAAERVTRTRIPVTVGPRRAGDPASLVADAGRARRELNWEPRATLDDIVRSAWTWMQAHPQGYGDRVGLHGPDGAA
jgi:UDP-glucose 4-epimerase